MSKQIATQMVLWTIFSPCPEPVQFTIFARNPDCCDVAWHATQQSLSLQCVKPGEI
ncbi:MAG: hypothetical protein JXR76_28970 [Deltaproteobacteria bacterium]|nr:hypothetical protein [Deltaproteobacteria bacterium]